MSNPGYVRSTDGSDADDGSTWALANATLSGAITDALAGETIYVSQVHAQTQATGLTLTFPGTLASPNFVVCANDAAQPPTAVATTGTVTTTGGTSIVVNGCAYFYGLEFSAGTGAASASFSAAQTDGNCQTYERCNIKLAGTVAGSRVTFGPTTAAGNNEGAVALKNTTLQFGATGQGLAVNNRTFTWDGGGLNASSSAITTLIATAPLSGVYSTLSGLDLSYGASSMNLIVTAATAYGRIVFRNCKLPASWSGSLFAASPTLPGLRAEMYNCDSGDTNYRLWVEDYSGSVRSETTIVRTGGASDGTTGLSWKMVSTANAEYPLITLDTPEIVRWNETTGSAITVTVETITDNVTLTDAECWLEVQYLGTSGFPLGTFINDCKADFIATAASQTSSSVTWTTTGLTTPTKQKMSVTFTPQEKGFIHAVVKLAKASTTVYVCPELDVT